MKEQNIKATVSTKEAGELLGLSTSTVCRLWNKGFLTGYKLSPSIHSRLRIHKSSIDELRKKRDAPPD